MQKEEFSRQQFQEVTAEVTKNMLAYLPEMIAYKKTIQVAVLDIATAQELFNVRDCIYTQSLVDKLINLARNMWIDKKGDNKSLFCAAMAVGTIIKEYEWGTRWAASEGVYEIASQIANK